MSEAASVKVMNSLSRRQLFRIAGAGAMAAVLPKALPAQPISLPWRRTGVGRYSVGLEACGAIREFRMVITAIDGVRGTITVSVA